MQKPKKNSTASARLVMLYKWFQAADTTEASDLNLVAHGKLGARPYFISHQVTGKGSTLYQTFVEKAPGQPVELVEEIAVERRDANLVILPRTYNDCGQVTLKKVFTHILQTAIPVEVMSLWGHFPAGQTDDPWKLALLGKLGFLIKPKPDPYFVMVLPWVALKYNHRNVPLKDESLLNIPEYLTYVFFDHKLRKQTRNIFFQRNLFLCCDEEHRTRYHIHRQSVEEDRYVYTLCVLHTIHFAMSVEVFVNSTHITQLATNEISDFHLLRPLVEEVVKDAINNKRPILTGDINANVRQPVLLKNAFRTSGFATRADKTTLALYLDMRAERP